MLSKFAAALSGLSVVGLFAASLMTPRLASQTEDQLKRYKAVEAYEIRPGILIMPRYDAGGQVCEIGIEKTHYSPEVIRHGSDLSRKEIDEITAELAPTEERGAESEILDGHEITLTSGDSMTTISEYEYVSIEIHAWTRPSNHSESTVETDAAVIHWKQRHCE